MRNALQKIIAILSVIMSLALFSACNRYEPKGLSETVSVGNDDNEINISIPDEAETAEESSAPIEETLPPKPKAKDTRKPTKVKGIYLAAKPLANEEFMSSLWSYLDSTELNAVVIDIKDDYGKITYDMANVPELIELNSIEASTEDMPALITKFKEHGIYLIARIVTMRDPHIANVRPEWCMTNPDGSLYKDNSGYPWVNPYETEYWDYILNIAKECAHIGFDEIQFDYMRFCTDKGIDDCPLDPDKVKDRDKISIITELMQYLSTEIKKTGAFVSCDCFGTIMQSKVDQRSVGQSYALLSTSVDYICPMIYPSHYSSGNFGLDAPDTRPYEAIIGALKRSKAELSRADFDENETIAVVRPWLQAFTASWLGSGKYIKYTKDEIRREIQAVYDSGYDEWILWSPSVSYDFDTFLSPDEAAKEEKYIAESRAALPDESESAYEETFPEELSEALKGDDLDESDLALLEEDGPLITYEK